MLRRAALREQFVANGAREGNQYPERLAMLYLAGIVQAISGRESRLRVVRR